MYPLALSVINDSATYPARRDAARRRLEGITDLEQFRRDIRAIVNDKARQERESFGVKIKPADITAQALEVAEHALTHERECIRDGYSGASCLASIRRWKDKLNGVSYFVVWIRIPQVSGSFAMIKVPFQNGYGSHPEWVAVDTLIGLGLFPRADRHMPGSYPVDFDDQGYMARKTLGF